MVQGSSVSILSGYGLGIWGSITCRNGHFHEALERTHRRIHWVPATARISVIWAWNLPFGFIVGQTTLMSSPGYCLTLTVAVQQWDSAFCIQEVPVGSQSADTLSWTSQGNDGSAPAKATREFRPRRMYLRRHKCIQDFNGRTRCRRTALKTMA
jgi:hypothetical protein